MSKKRTFYEYDDYEVVTQNSYNLLPFNFHKINDKWEVIVNYAGDFLLLPIGTAKDIVSRKVSKIENSDLYADLIANFFISEEPIHPLIDVLATKYNTKKGFLEEFTSLHIFVTTLRCEHTCKYCQVSRVTENKDAFDMKIEHFDKSIDYMFKSPSKHITMEFQGGEPLLAFDLIKYGVEKAKKIAAEKNKKITFVICSNIALINKEHLLFCKEHDILLSTSLDGPDFVHNKNRRRPGNNSYELFQAGFRLSKEILGLDKIGALMTTSKLSLEHPIEIIDEYVNLGFDSIFLRPISPYGFATKNEKNTKYDTETFLSFYKKGLAHIIDYNLNGKHLSEDYTTILLKKILTPFQTGYVDLQSPAGLINSVIVFNYDGYVYATDESRMLAEMGDFTFRLGHVAEDSYKDIFYGEKVKELSKYWLNENIPGCADCAFQIYCGADPVYNHATQGSLVGFRPTNGFCQRNMEIIRYLFELMIEDKRIEKIFRSWVK